MGLITAIAIFVVSLIIGSIGIYVGVDLLADSDVTFRSAIITALLGVIIYTVLGFLNFFPIIGPLLLLILWVGIINFRYPGGWGTAAGIGIVAWVVTALMLYVISGLSDAVSLSALGVPGL